MLRLVMISPLPPQRTGESYYTKRLVSNLVKLRGIEVFAVCGHNTKPLIDDGINARILPIWQGRNMLYPLQLLRPIRRCRPHIVHVQFGPHGEVYGGFFGEWMLFLLLFLRFTGITTTVTLHSTWMIEQVQKRAGTYRILGKLSILARPVFLIYMKLLNMGTTTIQLSTVKEGSLLRERFLKEYHYPSRKVLEIPHPYEQITDRTDRQTALEEIGLQGKQVVLAFGFIRRGKGLKSAIRSMKIVRERVKDAVLLIAGTPLDLDGKRYLDELKEQRRKEGLEDVVEFHDHFIPEPMLPVYMSAASIILIPYMDSVGVSGPAHNHAGYGVPILAADSGYHMKETLGGNIVLYSRKNPEELPEKMVKLLADHDFARSVGASLRAYTQKETWYEAIERTMENYKKTVVS